MLTTAVERLRELVRVSAGMLQVIGVEAPALNDAERLESALRMIGRAPPDRIILANPVWQTALSSLKAMITSARAFCQFATDVDQSYTAEAWSYDTASMLMVLRADGPSFVRRFSSRYRSVNADLRALCKERLRRYEYPHVVHFVDELPRTPSGKVQRFKLRETAAQRAAR